MGRAITFSFHSPNSDRIPEGSHFNAENIDNKYNHFRSNNLYVLRNDLGAVL